MLKELKKESNYTRTENGALTYKSTQSECLDLFSAAGALRRASVTDISNRIARACAEDLELTLKIVFFARDIRGGMGERRFFRIALLYLAENHPEALEKNVALIPEFGRYDDLLMLLGTPCERAAVELVKSQLDKDMKALETESGEVSLLGKWLPSVNTSSAVTVKLARKLAGLLGMSEPEYRKACVALRKRIKIIEDNLRRSDYTFDYSKQPSKAMLKYRKAFIRNDYDRYNEFLSDAAQGKAKLNAATLAPYDIVNACISSARFKSIDDARAERLALDTAWNALGDYVADGNALAVVDGSGSMYMYVKPSPAAVAQSLGIYFAERAKGAFHGHFITFSESPRLIEVKGKDIYEKVRYCMSFDECANTDISRVFELILDTAVKNKLPQSDMPSALYIISDMEFDDCAMGADVTNFENARATFAAAGYELPMLVFWNVDSRGANVPVTMNDRGVILVSGSSPQVFAMLRSGNYSPYEFMLQTLSAERYSAIKA